MSKMPDLSMEAKHSRHSLKRAQQRAVNQQMIDDTIAHGEMIRKQGLRFFVITKKALNFINDPQYCDHLKNTVVILSADNTILTVYKNARGMRSVRKKPKIYYG